MSFIEIPGLGDIEEQRVADGDQEYELLISSCEHYKKLASGERVDPAYVGDDVVGHNMQLLIAFDGRPELQPFNHWLVLPLSTDESDRAEGKVRRLRRNVELMDIHFDSNGFDEDSIVGTTFVGKVVKEVMTDASGEERKEDDGAPRWVNRLIVPRFRG